QTQINSLFNQAGDLYLQGNKIEAEEKLQKLIGQSPDFALAYKLLGDLKFDARLFKAAIANYEQALELGLGAAAFYNLYNDIGISYMRLEEYAQAVKYLKQALELEPDNLGILYNLACVLRDNGDYPEATARYQELIEQRFDFPNVHNDLGDIYQLSGQEQLAQEQYSIELANAQLADNPETLENLNRLALAYNGLGQYAQAKEIIGRAIESSLDDGEALYTRARILENLGDNQGAIKDLQKAKQFFSGTKFIDNYIIRLSPGAD
ncbi:MAG: tetratricopeptide repeat protein, partial [Candidatus Omnitrophica bacterium]|nr:tetratricopeptide repeat protein [Candidatus Omnitrophota bacterium]